MRIVIAVEHRLLREGLKAALARADVDVVGDVGSGHDVLALAHESHPDVVLMDITMPELNGIDATRRLKAMLPSCKVLTLGGSSERRYLLGALAAGASGYLLKSASLEELLGALDAIQRGERYLCSSLPELAEIELEATGTGRALRRAPNSAGWAGPLTVREREVLQLLAEGCSSKEMALRLKVAVPTVETHRRQIMDKLGLRTVAQLTKWAIREGLTTVD
jgi:two-component system response regulator NreC